MVSNTTPPSLDTPFRLRQIHSDDISPPILTQQHPPSLQSAAARTRRLRNRRLPYPATPLPPLINTERHYRIQTIIRPPPYTLTPNSIPSTPGTHQTCPPSPPPPYSSIAPNPQPAEPLSTTIRQALSVLSRPMTSNPSLMMMLQLFLFTLLFQIFLLYLGLKLIIHRVTQTVCNFGAWIHLIPPLLTMFAVYTLSRLIIVYYSMALEKTTLPPHY